MKKSINYKNPANHWKLSFINSALDRSATYIFAIIVF